MTCADLSPTHLAPLLEPACLKYVISKSLGYGIVAGSAAVKLPQVFNIIKAGNVDGLSGSTILIEWMSSIGSFSYYMALGYPFSTWGENFFLFFQNAIIASLYIRFTTGLASPRFVLTVLFSAALFTVLYTRSLPDIVLPPQLCSLLSLARCTFKCEDVAGGLPVILMLFGRLPQIIANQRQGHTGSLSLITYALNVAGCSARVFTVLQELDDKFALSSALSGFLQNTVLVLQILILGSGASAAAKKKKKGSPSVPGTNKGD
eukprot:CAMPEP_0174731266 /NCGR_PEP_ID=MMETSP1094-20130205/57195_1 /TAXON_ID=156173 /ORGANISM="Chrysochromulina brevifilum, Strain UTEX LB 985" /LENGTH=261 /DNA_ID=CAMNT_0015933629 /DNA_START=62 /DNA_END=847 /DNA_ORIENTATION=+